MSAIPGYFFVDHFQRATAVDLKLVYVVLEGQQNT